MADRAVRDPEPHADPDASRGLAMLGTGAHRPTVAFLAWFGPRGAASIVFALLVVEEGGLPHAEVVLTTAFVTVGLSVLAHGVSAAPLAGALRKLAGAATRAGARPARIAGNGRASLETRARGPRMRIVSTEEARRIAVRAQLLDGSATTCSTRFASSATCRSTRSRPSLLRSSSSSGAGSARTRSRSSTACSGRSESSSSGTPSSGRSSRCRCCGRACGVDARERRRPSASAADFLASTRPASVCRP